MRSSVSCTLTSDSRDERTMFVRLGFNKNWSSHSVHDTSDTPILQCTKNACLFTFDILMMLVKHLST